MKCFDSYALMLLSDQLIKDGIPVKETEGQLGLHKLINSRSSWKKHDSSHHSGIHTPLPSLQTRSSLIEE